MALQPITIRPELYQEMLLAERDLTDSLREADKAEECGIDCQQHREKIRIQLETISKLKQNFAPPVSQY